MKRKRKPKTVESELLDQRSDGMYARAASWNPNGDKKNNRKTRRDNKQELKKSF